MLVLGASFAMGTPYTHQQDGYEKNGGMASFIRAGLEAQHPNRRIEVLNLAAGGQTAHRVARVAEEAVAMAPDLLFVASCNNEGPPPPSELEERLHKLAGYRLLSRVLTPEVERAERPIHPRQLIDADSIEKTFRKNLEDIAAAAARTGVPVLLATMPVNYRYPDEHPPYLPCIEPGVDLIERGLYEQAVKHLGTCKDLSEAARWMGIALFKLERYAEADRALKLAVEIHPMTQCRPSLNQVIRDVAAANDHVHLADLESAAVTLSPGGIPGEELFVDFCHMNWKGYGEMAQVVLAALDEQKLGPAGTTGGQTLPSVEELAERFGLPSLQTGAQQRR
jgi:lysophospholipase L1-like esterase